jgi:SAF domain
MTAEDRAGKSRRRPLLAASGAMLVVVCAGLGAVVSGRAASRSSYLAVTRFVPAGVPISAPDLGTVSLPPTPGIAAVTLGELDAVLGRRSAVALEPGDLLVPADVASGPGLPAGRALVGASLATGQMPVELAPGDEVLVVASATGGPALSGDTSLGAGAGSRLVLARGTVVSTSAGAQSSDGQGGLGAGGAGGAGGTVATLDVPEVDAPAVAAASSAGDVSLVVIGGPG